MTPVALRGGVVVNWDVAVILFAIEAKGGTFHVEQGSIRVLPPGVLTAAHRAYLSAHKADALQLLTYVADDRHLTTEAPDGDPDQPRHAPDDPDARLASRRPAADDPGESERAPDDAESDAPGFDFG